MAGLSSAWLNGWRKGAVPISELIGTARLLSLLANG